MNRQQGGRPPRIAIDCRKADDFGIGTYVRGLTRALASLPGEEEYLLIVPPRLRGPLPSGGRFSQIVDPSRGYSLRELVSVGTRASRRADLFHATHYVLPFVSVPAVVTIHDLIHLSPAARIHPMARAYARVMLGRATRAAARILTVTETIARQIEELFPRAEGKVAVTPNGVDALFFERPGAEVDAPLLAGFGLRPGGYFLYVGNDKPHKNVETIVEACARLREETKSDAPLVLAGAVPGRFQQPHVRMTGFVPERQLAALYRGAIALLLPSLEEGFGLPAVEAMACGTAVITSDHPALIEVTGRGAMHVAARDVDGWIEAMRRVATDAMLRETLIDAAETQARACTWTATAEKTLEAYRTVIP